MNNNNKKKKKIVIHGAYRIERRGVKRGAVKKGM